MKKKQWISTIAAALLVASALSGCGVKKADSPSESPSNQASTQQPSSSAAPSAAKVAFLNGDWGKTTDQNYKKFEKWQQEYNSKYPNVDMKVEYFAYDTNTFLPKAESGQLPNLFATFFTEPQKLIKAGYAADLTEVLKERGYDTAINPDLTAIMQKDGKTYGIPSDGYTMGMWYNMNLMKKAGLLDDSGVPKFPQTYDELAEAAKTIKEKTGQAGFFFPTKNNQGGWMFMNIAWSFGADFIESQDGKWKAVFDSQEAVDALNWLKKMKWEYNALTDNSLVDANDLFRLFGTDQVGMSFGTADWMNVPVNDYKMSKDNLAMSRLPAGPKGRFTLGGGNLYMFSPNSTKEQINAGLDWLAIKGFSPAVDEEALKGMEETLKSDAELNRIVGPHGLDVWVNKDKVDAINALRVKYKTVNMDLFKDYMDNKDVTVKAEVPVNAQELYKSLDAVIQAVLTDKNADAKTLLSKAAADFQRDYLDKAN